VEENRCMGWLARSPCGRQLELERSKKKIDDGFLADVTQRKNETWIGASRDFPTLICTISSL
jgi:hypothetical protein